MAAFILMPEIKSSLVNLTLSPPKEGEKVYKDECIYCFNQPNSKDGLFVCLSSFYGVCENHLEILVSKKKSSVFLNIKKVPKEIVSEENAPPEKKPTKLAIGVEGGFDINKKIEYEDVTKLVLTDQTGNQMTTVNLPCPELPLNVQLSIAGVLTHQGASLQEDVQAWEEKRQVSKHALTLKQIDNGVRIPPSGWKCKLCDLKSNLWLNLTDGTILCGRRYFDGSGGNNHAVEYFEKTKFPLAVKLGTITAEGGDVYSYDEDDMVEDPKLKEHLLHFGININLVKKTDKTMTELEIEANLSLKAEWDTIQESGKSLTPLFGPGYTGMVNLGNSCYMNSIIQILFSMDEFKKKYGKDVEKIFQNENANPCESFLIQFSKLGHGLLSGNYSAQPEDGGEEMGIRPQMFKSLIGRGHAEFSTNHQQDAHEYLLHFLSSLEKVEAGQADSLNDLFTFQLEDRIECSGSHKVTYQKREEVVLSLPIPLEKATNKEEYEQFEVRRKKAEESKTRIPTEEIVRLNIPISECLDAFQAKETIDDFYSSALKAKTYATKTTRFATFPEYLVIQLQKFTLGNDWVPRKLDVTVDMLDELDLTYLRGTGKQQNEELLPEGTEEGQGSEGAPEINQGYVASLLDMGFPLEACKKAIYFTSNQGVEPAMNWIFEHSQDADFASPLVIETGGGSKKANTPLNPESISMIVSMGFTEDQAKKALLKNNNNLEAAAEWIFTHLDDLNSMEVDDPLYTQKQEKQYRDGSGKYRLFAFASHMGTSTSCGHYVCHVYKDDRWVIYNDRKVAISENPPKNLGYIYFYKRI